jgi:hypothetical protein
MTREFISLPASHPYAHAAMLANQEFAMGSAAADSGNEGRARVCGRRAVGTFVQTIAQVAGIDYGSHAMANLREITGDQGLPAEVRDAAERLLGGTRTIAGGGAYSADPLRDALLIINYFIAAAS